MDRPLLAPIRIASASLNFFGNGFPINHIRSLLSILWLLRWIAPAGEQPEFPPNLLADTGCVPADAPDYEIPLD